MIDRRWGALPPVTRYPGASPRDICETKKRADAREPYWTLKGLPSGWAFCLGER